MLRSGCRITCVVFAMVLAGSARGEPVRVTISGDDGYGSDPVTSQVIPDGFQGGTFDVGFHLLPPHPAYVNPLGPNASPPYILLPYDQEITGQAWIQLHFDRPSDPVSDGEDLLGGLDPRPTIRLTFGVHGHILGSNERTNLSGYYTGTVQQLELSQWAPSSDVPKVLIDNFLDPSRIHLTAVTDTLSPILHVYLTIDPPSAHGAPSPVPEPSSLAGFAVVLIGIARLRREGSRRSPAGG